MQLRNRCEFIAVASDMTVSSGHRRSDRILHNVESIMLQVIITASGKLIIQALELSNAYFLQ